MRLLVSPAIFADLQRASSDERTMADLLRSMLPGEAHEALMLLLRHEGCEVVVVPELEAAYLEIEPPAPVLLSCTDCGTMLNAPGEKHRCLLPVPTEALERLAAFEARTAPAPSPRNERFAESHERTLANHAGTFERLAAEAEAAKAAGGVCWACRGKGFVVTVCKVCGGSGKGGEG